MGQDVPERAGPVAGSFNSTLQAVIDVLLSYHILHPLRTKVAVTFVVGTIVIGTIIVGNIVVDNIVVILMDDRLARHRESSLLSMIVLINGLNEGFCILELGFCLQSPIQQFPGIYIGVSEAS